MSLAHVVFGATNHLPDLPIQNGKISIRETLDFVVLVILRIQTKIAS